MITITNLWKAFGPQDLFKGASLQVGARERVALVGPNGSGKTTLFEMLEGAQQPDRGEVRVLKQAVVGYLRQDNAQSAGRSLLEEVLSAAGDVTEMSRKLAVMEAELAEATEEEERDRLIVDYAELQERFSDADGYTVEFEAKAIIGGLGFREADLGKDIAQFSGGQLMRIALAKLLLAGPDLLMLDEPTNHLDLDAVEYLERFLRSYKGSVFFVSHDRVFIDSVASRVVEIDAGQLLSYKGDYESYLTQRELIAQQADAVERNRARQAADAQEFIDRFRAKATKARQVQSRIKAVEKMGGPAAPKKVRKSMGLSFPAPPRAGRTIVELLGVRFGYGDRVLYDGLDLALERNQKIALVGPNGAGKTTLLKLLAGVLEPQAGQRLVGHNAQLAYFAQHQAETLNLSNIVLDEISAAIPPGAGIRPGDLLGRFLFSGDDMRKPVSVLSGGERSRLAIAKLLVSPLNALFLDEPTNHLDIASRDVLEAALLDYQGALVLITHDRHLIRSVANRIVEVRDGRATIYDGGYDDYLAKRALRDAEAKALPNGKTPSTTKGSSIAKGPAKGSSNGQPRSGPVAAPSPPENPAERRKAAAQARAVTSDLRKSLGRIERQLESAGAAVRELSERLADPAVYSSGADVAALVEDYEAKSRQVRELEAAWEKAAGLLEAAGASV